jgi:uncharacterized membrane protein
VRSDYLSFRLQRFDLGNMVQAVWSTAHGRPLETTLHSGEQVARLASHVDPILTLFAPFWLLWPSPLLLAAVQIAACALGALPVFWLGRRHLESEKVAALLALSYLAYPWLAWAAIDAMHPVTLAIPLFLFAIWFLDSGRLWAFAACAVLILVTGELMGLPLAALGLWYGFAQGRRSAGLAIAGTGLAWTFVCVELIVPAFRGEENPFYGYFAEVGGSPEGILRTLFTDPGAMAAALFSSSDLVLLVLLALPLGGLFVLDPALAAVAAPQLAVMGLSSIQAANDPRVHYVAGVIPFLIAGSVVGLARLPRARRVPAAVAVCAACVAFSVAFGPLLGISASIPPSLYPPAPSTDQVAALHEAVALVPDGAPVAATNKAGSHLSARRYFFSVPVVRNAEWIVVDTSDPWVPLPPREKRITWGRLDSELVRAFAARIDRSARWEKVFERSGVIVFRRAAA